jgi:hypothetical protein
MMRKLKTGEYRLYARKRNAETGARRNLGTFLNFYINRAGSALPLRQKHILTHAKEELRQVFHEPARPISRRK